MKAAEKETKQRVKEESEEEKKTYCYELNPLFDLEGHIGYINRQNNQTIWKKKFSKLEDSRGRGEKNEDSRESEHQFPNGWLVDW